MDRETAKQYVKGQLESYLQGKVNEKAKIILEIVLTKGNIYDIIRLLKETGRWKNHWTV